MELIKDYSAYGQCRCCLAIGCHRDISKEYYNNGTREVYLEIFIDCFNLYLSTSQDVSSLICLTCIKRLQDAHAFRMLVLNTEKALLAISKAESIRNNDIQHDPLGSVLNEFDSSSIVKLEDFKLETDIDIENFTYNIDGFEPLDNVDILNNSNVIDENVCTIESEEQLIKRFPNDSIKPLPNRKTIYKLCPKYVWHLDALKGKKITGKSIEKRFFSPSHMRRQKDKPTAYITEKLGHAINACTILECSNAVAFKTKMRSGYPCFYCKEIYEDMDVLREHQVTHPRVNLFKLLTKYGVDGLVVYADVTDLKCSLCDSPLKALTELKCHLRDVHSKKLYEEFTDRVIPFKLIGNSDFKCQICGFNFETFGAIERHMNIHYRNYICDKCGAGFITKQRLKVHTYTLHNTGIYSCEKCKKTFSTYHKLKVHIDIIHNHWKPNKCPKCSERFTGYFTKQKHLVEAHGLKPINYKCNVCDRTFSRRYCLSMHLKRCHLEEKEVKCNQCAYMCYTKSELTAHMLKHGAGKMHECTICKKSYVRKKTLKEHIRRHNNDRKRFTCGVCGQAFVQNCSLKQHLESHHVDQQQYGK